MNVSLKGEGSDELEESSGEPQTLTHCRDKLKDIFNAAAIQKDKMDIFE